MLGRVAACVIILAFLSGMDPGPPASGKASANGARGWRLAPTARRPRRYPRLVNYWHMGSYLDEGQIDHLEERLAQWDVVILDPAPGPPRTAPSLSKIRQANPDVKLLAWIPLQEGIPHLDSHPGRDDWYAKTADGRLLPYPWGGYEMNPYVDGFAWPKHVVRHIAQRQYLEPGMYDGVLLDCMGEGTNEADLNEDGVHDEKDTVCYQESMTYLVRELRRRYPGAVITGNGGAPWSDDCPYFPYANGNMHENALGDDFGDPGWEALWRGYRTCVEHVPPPLAPYHLIVGDIQTSKLGVSAGNLDECARVERLGQEDLRKMRLGLGTALLDDGYFGFDRGSCLHGQLWWFDEYDADLGDACGPYRVDVYGAGIFSREFESGLVLVNPTSAPVAVGLTQQLRDVSSGQTGESVTVPAGDARILVKGSR